MNHTHGLNAYANVNANFKKKIQIKKNMKKPSCLKKNNKITNDVRPSLSNKNADTVDYNVQYLQIVENSSVGNFTSEFEIKQEPDDY